MTDAQRAAKAEHKLFLRLERKDFSRVGVLLASETGSVPVYFHIPSEKITLLCPQEQWCNGGDRCVLKLRDALGTENVVLK